MSAVVYVTLKEAGFVESDNIRCEWPSRQAYVERNIGVCLQRATHCIQGRLRESILDLPRFVCEAHLPVGVKDDFNI